MRDGRTDGETDGETDGQDQKHSSPLNVGGPKIEDYITDIEDYPI